MANEYRFYQVGLEVVHNPPADVQFYQVGLEVVHNPPADVRIYQLNLELMHSPLAAVQLYSTYVEVLRTLRIKFEMTYLDEGDGLQPFRYNDDFLFEFFSDIPEEDGEWPKPVSLADWFNFDYFEDQEQFGKIRLYLDHPPSIPHEWNPYRPDLPEHVSAENPDLYNYLREQAEILRDQHNLTQAGDSTFPWQMMVTPGDTKVHTLGSVSRFVHADYGLMQARYVRFSDNYEPVIHSFVGHDIARGDWRATNQSLKTDLFRVIGMAGPYAGFIQNRYGWVVTQGRSPFELIMEHSSKPVNYQRFTWAMDTGRGVVGAGPQVGIILDDFGIEEKLQSGAVPYSPRRWLVPAGAWFVDVQGVTPEYIAAQSSASFGALTVRVADLEAAVAGLEAAAGGDVSDLTARVGTLESQLGFEITSRISGQSNLDSRLDVLEAYDFSSFATVGALTVVAGNVAALSASLTAYETTTDATLLSHGSRITALEYVTTTLDSRVDVLEASVAILNSVLLSATFLALTDTPSTYASQTLKLVRVNAGETALEFVSLTSGLVTDFNEAVDDRVNALFVAGANITLTYDDTLNTFTIAASGGGGGSADYVLQTLYGGL